MGTTRQAPNSDATNREPRRHRKSTQLKRQSITAAMAAGVLVVTGGVNLWEQRGTEAAATKLQRPVDATATVLTPELTALGTLLDAGGHNTPNPLAVLGLLPSTPVGTANPNAP